MATIQLGNTKVAGSLIKYAEKRSVERSGVDCDPKYAQEQFKATRELYGKREGIQAHHVIQSFAPGEIEPSMANQVGKDLAREIAKGHEALVYTHADKGHIHNHIIINAVSHEDGKKYQSKKSDLYRIREKSDELCKERGLSVVKEPTAKVRYTLAEKSVIEKGGVSWKNELRQAIDFEKARSSSYNEFKQNLTEKYGIEVNDKGKHITYKHPDHEKVVRGKNLGLDYERGTIEHGFSRQIERGNGKGNDPTELLLNRDIKPHQGDFSRAVDLDQQTKQDDRGTAERKADLSQGTRGRTESPHANDRKAEPSGQRLKSDHERPDREQQSESGPTTHQADKSNSHSRNELQGNHENADRLDFSSQEDTHADMERESEPIRSATADDSRSIGGADGGLSVGNGLDEVLQALDGAIKKADAIEKAENRQQELKQAKAMERKMQPTKSRGRERGGHEM